MIIIEKRKIGLKNEITIKQINSLQLNQEYLHALHRFRKKSIDTPRVTQKILEFLKN